MGTLQLNSHNLNSLNFKNPSIISSKPTNHHHHHHHHHHHLSFSRAHKIRAVQTVSDAGSEAAPPAEEQESPAVNFAFVHSVLLPDGTPDVHYRTACGGQKLRDIMLDHNIDLYGPYSRPLLNCGGGGTCGTCIVEVIDGRELLSPRTEKEKEKLKRNPKNWRLACQATVGSRDSRGLVVIQQLPEWKAHEWTSGKEPPEDEITYL